LWHIGCFCNNNDTQTRHVMVQNALRMQMVTEAINVMATSDSTLTQFYIGQYELHSHWTAV